MIGILRIAMMIPVKQTIIFVRQQDGESRQIAYGDVERAALEGRLVGGFVDRHEQEGDKEALRDDQRQDPA
jgi:hypothetical protein